MIKYAQLRKKDKDTILEMYHAKHSYHEIAEAIDYPYSSVARYLKGLGLDRQIRGNTKYCNQCSSWLPLDQFYVNNLNSHGLSSSCKICFNQLLHKNDDNIIQTTDIIDYPERIVEYKSFRIYIKDNTYVLKQHGILIIEAISPLDTFYAEMLNIMLASVISDENQLIIVKHARKIKRLLLKSSE